MKKAVIQGVCGFSLAILATTFTLSVPAFADRHGNYENRQERMERERREERQRAERQRAERQREERRRAEERGRKERERREVRREVSRELNRIDHRGRFGSGNLVIVGNRHVFRYSAPIVWNRPFRARWTLVSPTYFDYEITRLMRAGRVVELGSTRLSRFGTDFDLIHVSPYVECGIKQVRIRVQGQNAQIDHIVLTFANGQTEEIDTAEYYFAGGMSAWKDLPGYSRCINDISVIGRTTTGGAYDQALVEVYGLR